eukprot:c14427_g1_i1.p1 GENE.c14427_g1_i1~~c14427_g1_i1.p1  ORF type:complete len:106 (+),score=15.82 c14427_g1_i1:110-427(+)
MSGIKQLKTKLESAFKEICSEVINNADYDDEKAQVWRENIVERADNAVQRIVGDGYKIFITCTVLRRTGYVKSHSSLSTEKDFISKFEYVGETTLCFLDCVCAKL